MMLLETWNGGGHNPAVFDSPTHTVSVLYGLNRMRNSGMLLDVILVTEGVEFPAHRVVLASCSDYFRAMFSEGMKEAKQEKIELNVSANGMKYLLDYIYTARLPLNLESIQDILSVATYFQLVGIIEACSAYLRSQLDLENCLEIASIGELYSLKQLQKEAYKFINGHLLEFAYTKEFKRLTFKQLQFLLSSDFPVDCSENSVLNVVLQWIHTTESERDKLSSAEIDQLLRHINFDKVIKRENCDEHYKHFYNNYDSLTLEKYMNSTVEESAVSSPLINSRGMELTIVKVGGFTGAGITNEVTYFQQSYGKWRHLTVVPHIEQCNHGTVVFNNELYIIGGCYNQSLLQENIHPYGFRYNAVTDKWLSIAPMLQERCRFSLNVICGKLYAIGGWSEMDGELRTDEIPEFVKCEYYDPRTDSWTVAAGIPEYRSQHAAATCPERSQYLYVTGGLDRDSAGYVLNTMWKYDSVLNFWAKSTDMLTPRADHTMFSRGNDLYVCGGWYEDEATEERILVDTIDRYNDILDQWEVITTVPTPRFHTGIVAICECIYFIGGYRNSGILFDRSPTLIECYNLNDGTWTIYNKYPEAIWEHACVSLFIPRCRDDPDVKTLRQ